MVLRDFDSYRKARETAEKLYNQPEIWNRMCAVNIAQAGRFASDRSIREYAENIWHTNPLPAAAAKKPAAKKPAASTAKKASGTKTTSLMFSSSRITAR